MADDRSSPVPDPGDRRDPHDVSGGHTVPRDDRHGDTGPLFSGDAGADGSTRPAGEDDLGAAGGDERPAAKGDRRSSGSFLRELPVLLVIAFVLAFVLRTFVLQVFFIPSSSMEPTLQIDDRMVVEKVTYLFREPRRGEIVVFEGESLGSVNADANVVEQVVRGAGQFVGLVPASARDFVKRVIGLPGDEVVIEQGQVFVNGEPLDEPYALLDQSDFGPVTVPDDSLFFLGDNRANSSDSRRSLGFVPMDQVVGRSVVVLWPWDNSGLLTGVEYPDVPDPEDASGTDEDGEPGPEDETGESAAGDRADSPASPPVHREPAA